MQSRERSLGRWAAFTLAWIATAGVATGAPGTLAAGDAAWERRAEGANDGIPLPGPNDTAIRSYARALDGNPSNLELRWKLLRSLHFAGEFGKQSAERRRAYFERGTAAAELGLSQLAERAGGGARLDEQEDAAALAARIEATGISQRDVARLHFWAAIHWGAWSQDRGLLAAVREGVANRIHRYTLVAIALEPEYEEGGALRLLGRLHAELPRVPFVSGWVDRSQAIPQLERALEIGPEHPGNRLLLALTLLDLEPARRDEALALLEQVTESEPRASMRIEGFAIREEARRRLTAEQGSARAAG